MKILLIHNRYQQAGGEDYVFEREGELLSCHGHFVERLVFDNKSIQTLTDKFLAAVGTFYNLTSSRMLESKIKAIYPDVIHVHNFLPLASPSIFVIAHKYNIPVVFTLHNYRLICPGATLFFRGAIYEKSIYSIFPIDAILKGVYRNSILETAAVATMTAIHHLAGTWKNKIDRYIVLTDFAKMKFVNSALNIPKYKFVLKPNFVTDNGAGADTRENYFLFAGRLTAEKGIDTLLSAAQLGKFNLMIAGDGPLKNQVEEACTNNPNIRYLGFQSKKEVIQYLKACKALIFPSQWYEGFPITILEAFSTGTPVITSRLGSMAEIVNDHFNGLHFEAGNVKELSETVKKISSDFDLAEALSRNARQTYLNKFTPEINYTMLLEIYKDSIIEKNHASAKRFNKVKAEPLR